MDQTHYDNLQVARNASDEVIKGAYKYLSQKWHPDRQPLDRRAEAERVMKLINAAYAVLIDPEARKKHDEWIREQEEGEGLFRGASRTSSTAAGAASGSTGSGTGTAKSQLSDDVRAHFIETIASNAWPLHTFQALIGTIFWLFILFFIAKLAGFLSALDQFIDKYPWIYLIVYIGLMWTAFGIAKEEKRKSLYKLSDDLLAIKFQETKGRKVIFIVGSIAVLIGGMIAFAVAYRSDSASSTSSTSSPRVSTSGPTAPVGGERVIPPFARPDPAPAAVPSPAIQKVRVINECHRPAEVLFAREAPSQFSVTKTSVLANSDDVYVLGAPLVEKRDAEAYWSARSVDRALEWVEKNETQGAAFVLDDKTVRFFEASSDKDSEGTYFVKLLCPKPKLEWIN